MEGTKRHTSVARTDLTRKDKDKGITKATRKKLACIYVCFRVVASIRLMSTVCAAGTVYCA